MAKKHKKKASKKKLLKKASPVKATPGLAALERKIDAVHETLQELMPLHLKTTDGALATGVNKVGLTVQDGSPGKLNAWVEDELVLFQGKSSGESRPRPIGETITITVEADGNPNQPVRIALTHTDRPLYADRVPSGSTHYEGGDRFKVT